jgi:hypothetical protein
MRSVRGQTRKSGHATGKSALPPSTDIVSPACQVRFVPKGDMDTQLFDHLVGKIQEAAGNGQVKLFRRF